MFTTKITPEYSGIEEKQKAIAVYWGTFDPVTEAHFDIIKEALKLNFKKVIVAINDNKATGKTYKSSGESRLEMLEIMRADLSPEDQERLEIVIQKDKEFEYTNIKKIYPGAKVTAVVGQDSFEKFGAGCKWCDQVLVAPRGEKSDQLKKQIKDLGLTNNTHVLSTKKQFLATSSTEVRQAINDQKSEVLSLSMHPKVIDFIKKKGLFRENKSTLFQKFLFEKPKPRGGRQLHGHPEFNPNLR